MIFNTQTILAKSGVLFGTSGARGLVEQFTPDVCAAFTHSFVTVMQQSYEFDTVAIAIDNRPSSYQMAQACAQALSQLGLQTQFYGVVPTPAMAYVAMQHRIPSIMVTGSHIPFDRNGLKFYRPDGEISKQNELAILEVQTEYIGLVQLDPLQVNPVAAEQYIQRYLNVFSDTLLLGKRIGIYQHSSAGRDIYSDLFIKLGADVIELERSDIFVPIDTEAVSEKDCQKALEWVKKYQLDALFSTDGDGDRPMLADENGQWLRGDILGLLCSKYLDIDALAIPVSCNTAIEHTELFKEVNRTKIGSPYVIEAFAPLLNVYNNVAGFEANGGYLLGSDLLLNQGRSKLTSLPTRDAVLPVLAVLALSKDTGISAQVASLPQRFTHSDRLQNFPTDRSRAIIALVEESPSWLLNQINFCLSDLTNVNTTDGLRLSLSSGIIIHLRPSGNAPEFRCYVESEDFQKSKSLVDLILEILEKSK
ncbi:phosphomannomutase [Shewanella sp.]|uniref:phosphomannomutase n=1 Tax=Shewanella sp. TaxID=50422 RepID=UPI0040475440